MIITEQGLETWIEKANLFPSQIQSVHLKGLQEYVWENSKNKHGVCVAYRTKGSWGHTEKCGAVGLSGGKAETGRLKGPCRPLVEALERVYSILSTSQNSAFTYSNGSTYKWSSCKLLCHACRSLVVKESWCSASLGVLISWLQTQERGFKNCGTPMSTGRKYFQHPNIFGSHEIEKFFVYRNKNKWFTSFRFKREGLVCKLERFEKGLSKSFVL